MKKYIIKRLLWLIPILLVISFISFSLMYLSPGDPAEIYLTQGGEAADPVALAELRGQLGLDKPFFVRYFDWLFGVFRGDFGTSIFSGKSVIEEILIVLPNTIYLTLLSMALTLLIAIPLGIVCAVYENKFIDYVIRVMSFINGSLPGFFAAMIVIYILGIQLKWLPTISSGKAVGIWIPTIALAICLSAVYTRQIRTCVITELGEEYIRMKRARGIKERTILYRDALKSVTPYILTLAGINVGKLLGGTAIIEIVCTYQGLGRMAVTSILNRDYPIMQGYVLLMAAIYVIVNLLVDILHAYTDPRVKQRLIESQRKRIRNPKGRKYEKARNA